MLIKLCVLIISSVLLSMTDALVCPPDYCAGVQCPQVKLEECNGHNQIIEPGGFCACCNLCHTILGKGDDCPVLQNVLLGAPPPTVRCATGLFCLNGKCEDNSQLITPKST